MQRYGIRIVLGVLLAVPTGLDFSRGMHFISEGLRTLHVRSLAAYAHAEGQEIGVEFSKRLTTKKNHD